MKPRPYQSSAVNGTFTAWEDVSTALGVLPTGCGKTIVAAMIVEVMLKKNPGKRALMIAHRKELVWQAKDKIEKVTGFLCAVEMGEHKAELEGDMLRPRADVIITSVQTQNSGGDGGGRIGKFDPADFCVLIYDEAHHAVAPGARRVIDYYRSNPDLKVLGLTATPDRADEEALGQIFDAVAFDYEILDAINDGWLLPVMENIVSVEIDFSHIRTTAGDLNGADLDAVMTAEKALHEVTGGTLAVVGNKQGIGFASSVHHAMVLSDIFNRHKPGMSACVSAKTSEDDRARIIGDFKSGKLQWMWNCGIFGEGFDAPNTEIISIARPTKSRALFAQMVGRSLRPHDSIAHSLNNFESAFLRRGLIARSLKPSALVVNFSGNAGKHKLMTTADILGGNVSEQAVNNAIINAIRRGGPVKMADELQEEERKVEQEKRRLEEIARKKRITGTVKTMKVKTVNPFEVLDIKPVVERGWDRNKKFTEKQREFLRKIGYNPDEMEYSRGKQLIGIMLQRWRDNKCTIKQANILKKFGYSTDLSFDHASKVLDAVAKNGWRHVELSHIDLGSHETAEAPQLVEKDNVPF